MKNGHKNPMLRWQMCNEWKIQFPNPLFRSPPPFCFILLNKRDLKNNLVFLNTCTYGHQWHPIRLAFGTDSVTASMRGGKCGMSGKLVLM